MLKQIFILFNLFLSVYSHSFVNCGTNIIGIDSINLLPDPPKINNNLQVTINGTANNNINNPILQLEVEIMNVPVYSLKIDICKNNSCPLVKNKPYSLVFNYEIPDEQISDLTVDLKLDISEDNNNIGCIEMETMINNDYINSYYYMRPKIISDNIINKLFYKWISKYNKVYNTIIEKKNRYNIFKTNTLFILNHNNNNYKLGHNYYSDMGSDEYKKKLGFKYIPKTRKNISINNLNNYSIPDIIDWRKLGAVTPVKNQGSCGSCWSFSTTGALEGAYFVKTGNLISFSEQQLVSCDNTDNGCNGGLMDNAFKWISNNNGLCSENSYPYISGKGTVNTCNKCTTITDSKIINYKDVESNTESLKKAVAKQPVAVAIEADHLSFQLYHSGVYEGNCGNSLDHGVLIVGYGTLNNNDYWIVKNSWGNHWGNNGYIYIKRGKIQNEGGECGIELSASYPEL